MKRIRVVVKQVANAPWERWMVFDRKEKKYLGPNSWTTCRRQGILFAVKQEAQIECEAANY